MGVGVLLADRAHRGCAQCGLAEQVGGFYLVESDDLDDLLDCCKIITAVGDGIEVRRTVDPAERPS